MKLPLLSGREVMAALERLGFHEVHRKGSHVKMEHPDGRRIVFPFHDEIDRYTLKGALRAAAASLPIPSPAKNACSVRLIAGDVRSVS